MVYLLARDSLDIKRDCWSHSQRHSDNGIKKILGSNCGQSCSLGSSPNLALFRQELLVERISSPLQDPLLEKGRVLREPGGVGTLRYLNCMSPRKHKLYQEQKVRIHRLANVHKA